MIISDYQTLKDIQAEFHRTFPGLKIEFYASPHQPGKGSPKREQIDPGLQLKFVRAKHTKGELQLSPDMSVAELESALQEQFGLHAQVFRKSGNLWMQTTSTDDWPLERQNRKGTASEAHYNEKQQDL
ncbi:hypothetical protein [Phaeodactylibacter luteus]|uniref:Uncharacterized protein n=1 Tax=Phaeodactylibacter luteus TaxID=1564516 RepID=A0A5C6RHN3_9BACT|nr:hypothetical protein [Phaeodactylibacter luteus]TXB61906.1 hypothetical protein FRY97_16790 [Phaeodactylibacter luteus]